MSSRFQPQHLDVAAFAGAKAHLSARDSLQNTSALGLRYAGQIPI
jgi:hypothetical protein